MDGKRVPQNLYPSSEDEGSEDEVAVKENLAFKRVPQNLYPSSEDEGSEDEVAVKENLAFKKEDLSKKAIEKDFYRKEFVKDKLLHVIITILSAFAIIVMLGLIIWAYHLLVPIPWHWLSENQIFEIQKIMSGGLLAMVFGEAVRKYLK